MRRIFDDRAEAGRLLAEELVSRGYEDPVVLALPRGGLPVAAEVARALDAPLDLVLVRKIGMPGHRELALGAIVDGDDPQTVFNKDLMRLAGIAEADLEREQQRLLEEIERRRELYLAGRQRSRIEGRTAIVVDDGIATGATARAALKAIRCKRPALLVLAVPVAAPETLAMLQADVDEIVCLEQPASFRAVGYHYRDFPQLDDGEVTALLAQHPA